MRNNTLTKVIQTKISFLKQDSYFCPMSLDRKVLDEMPDIFFKIAKIIGEAYKKGKLENIQAENIYDMNFKWILFLS